MFPKVDADIDQTNQLQANLPKVELKQTKWQEPHTVPYQKEPHTVPYSNKQEQATTKSTARPTNNPSRPVQQPAVKGNH